MAYKDSSEIANNSNYALGEYSFRIERSSVPGSSNDQITAICTQGGKNARKSIQIPSNAQMSGWYVEANETEATVYAMIAERGSGGGSGGAVLHSGDIIGHTSMGDGNVRAENVSTNPPIYITGTTLCALFRFTVTWVVLDPERGVIASGSLVAGQASYEGESFYVTAVDVSTIDIEAAYECLFGGGEYGDPMPMMVGRFAIDLEDAGGVGPGSDWTDPGDYDEDWEEGDPTHTLYVTVTGALSGRHNDPIVDPNYSYIPADKDTVKDYGCGGDGGHGGGGGAGASTVVVHKFATNQANYKEVTAIARRHGYGSGGGKGGKGGDGCILVYY